MYESEVRAGASPRAGRLTGKSGFCLLRENECPISTADGLQLNGSTMIFQLVMVQK